MNRIRLLIVFFLAGFIAASLFGKYTGGLPEGLKAAFQAGNSKEIAKFLDTNIELEILGTDNVYTREHAEQILKSFFEKHPVKGFTVLFEGGKEVSQYAIGKLVTSNGTYRINLLVKSQLVLQIRIMEDDGNQ
jgi:hypothetical protein